ncbi:thioredoxin-disulfide reductase [Candidatus Woesearchaeota archaeon]|nr:thioredoxin-disulfide reductase [Candidatus Woesearchaeota archaeon]
MEKLVIIGAGIAGLTAAIYAARANLQPLVISGKEEGGQLMLTTVVENYPCFPEGIMGPDMISRAREQAKRFGTRFKDGNVEAFGIKSGGNNIGKENVYDVVVDGEKIEAKSVIIATGASARMLGLESEKKYWNRGVHTCATCDAPFYSGKDIVVVGGGDSACEESLFSAKVVNSVTIIHRRDAFRASMIMQERVLGNSKIKVVWNSSVEEILGDGKKVTAVKIKNVNDGKASELKTDAVFLAIGHIPNSAVFKGILDLDENGYIKADSRMRTKLPGVFVAGDVHDKIYRQAVTAAGMGCQAALEAERYMEGITRG